MHVYFVGACVNTGAGAGAGVSVGANTSVGAGIFVLFDFVEHFSSKIKEAFMFLSSILFLLVKAMRTFCCVKLEYSCLHYECLE